MAASHFVEVSDKDISEIKMNSDQKNTKSLCKNTKTIIRLRLGDTKKVIFYFSFISPSYHVLFPLTSVYSSVIRV
jgi:hypothetical protein